MEDYIESKKQIMRFQNPGDVTVLGHDNEITRSLVPFAKGQVALFSLETEVAEGAFLRHQQIVLRLRCIRSIYRRLVQGRKQCRYGLTFEACEPGTYTAVVTDTKTGCTGKSDGLIILAKPSSDDNYRYT